MLKRIFTLFIGIVMITGLIVFSLTSYYKKAPYSSFPFVVKAPIRESLINTKGMTIQSRYETPSGYERIPVEEGSFEAYLRNLSLLPYGTKVKYYDGREKPSEGVYDSVVDVEIGSRDLHQCADAIMLLRAEYLYENDRKNEIAFNFTNGFRAEYSKWMQGYRIKVSGNDVSWEKQAKGSDTYESFRSFMNMVFAYAGTISLSKELEERKIEDMQIGDVFIIGASPGHAVIVVDMAIDIQSGKKAFMLAQSYMPAQQTQILINPNDESLSPWYTLTPGEILKTPEYTFRQDDLMSFEKSLY